MKHYIYTAHYKQQKYGQHITLRVYQVKNNVPIFIGDREYNTGSMKGNRHECLDVLLDKKHITQKDYDLSHTLYGPHQGPGYYHDNKKYIIHELQGQ